MPSAIEGIMYVQMRRGTSDAWTTTNPVLLRNEIALDLDTLGIKVGDGVTPWITLPYANFEDAPSDGKRYGRRNGVWVEL